MTFPVCLSKTTHMNRADSPQVGGPDALCHSTSHGQPHPSRLRSAPPQRHHTTHPRSQSTPSWWGRHRPRSSGHRPTGARRGRLVGEGAAYPARQSACTSCSGPEGSEPIATRQGLTHPVANKRWWPLSMVTTPQCREIRALWGPNVWVRLRCDSIFKAHDSSALEGRVEMRTATNRRRNPKHVQARQAGGSC
jgi:hypothetical protein